MGRDRRSDSPGRRRRGVGPGDDRRRASKATRGRPPLEGAEEQTEMPSLIRFLIGVAVVAALGFAVMFALANFVDPHPREMTIRIPQDRLDPR